ncbi:MAG: PEP-CTERM sorting domain-containing protein [Lentisphaeria bacterium]
MKTISVVKTMIAGAVLLAAVTAAQAAIVYDFSSNANGWSVIRNGIDLYQSTFGNTAGSIGITPTNPWDDGPVVTLDAVTFGKDFDIVFDWYATQRTMFYMGNVYIGLDSSGGPLSYGTDLPNMYTRPYSFSAAGWTSVEWKSVGGLTTLTIGGVDLYTDKDYSSVLADSGNKFKARIWSEDTAYLDNFTVIPEPASLALLAVAGTVMLRRRRA